MNQLDLSDNERTPHSDGEDDESDLSPSPSKVKNKDRYNLLNYNSERKEKLFEFDYSQEKTKDPEFDLDDEIAMATKIKTNKCNGDLEISLFWEEKLVIMIRFFQLYGIIFYFYYELWPASMRLWFTGMFSGFNFNFIITDQDKFYGFMQDFELVKIYILGGCAATAFFYGISICVLSARKLRFRIENKPRRKTCCNFYRFWFWVMEIMMLPLLFNVAWPSTCNFWSAREAIALIDCKEDGDMIYWIMKAIKTVAFLFALAYNAYLFSIL